MGPHGIKHAKVSTYGFVWRETHSLHEAYAFIYTLGMWFNIDDMDLRIGWFAVFWLCFLGLACWPS